MALYVARKTWRNRLLWWLRQRLLDLANWCGDAVDYEQHAEDDPKYYRFTFFNAKTGKETPPSPWPWGPTE
jgi:hypothetical protein